MCGMGGCRLFSVDFDTNAKRLENLDTVLLIPVTEFFDILVGSSMSLVREKPRLPPRKRLMLTDPLFLVHA